MFFVKKKVDEDKILLEEIKNILFPPLELYTDKENNSFHIDSSVDTNIESVITDLEDGYNDETSRKTLKSISERLNKIRKLLNAEQKINKNAKYIVVDDHYNKDNEV